jgi:hypothetical protein
MRRWHFVVILTVIETTPCPAVETTLHQCTTEDTENLKRSTSIMSHSHLAIVEIRIEPLIEWP